MSRHPTGGGDEVDDVDDVDEIGDVGDVGDVDEGPWVNCPRCGREVPLAAFAASDEESDAAVGVCRSCGGRIVIGSPAGSDG